MNCFSAPRRRNPAFLTACLTSMVFAAALPAAEKLSANPTSVSLENADPRKITFRIGDKAQSEDTIKLTPLDADLCDKNLTLKWTEDKSALTVTASKKLPKGVRRLDCELKAESVADHSQTAKVQISVVEEKAGEWESRAVFGFHQAGASSSESKQNYFFDFFIMRGLGNHAHVYDSRFNIWGNVRIASAPQQVDTAAATFIANFATEAGKLKVNELAQGGEFLTGLGMRLRKWDQGERIRMLEWVAFWGASGAFTDPGTAKGGGTIYKTPGPNSQQLQNFNSQFPGINAPYIGLTAPDRERFYRQYGSGIRVTGFEKNRPYAPPSTYMVTLGQDQLISGGFYRGVVARADVFYPLPIGKEDGKWQFLYLFGTANLRLSKPSNGVVLALEPAAASVNLFDPNVAIVSRASSRDTYRIGLGIDFVNLLNSWRGSRATAGGTK